MSWKNLRDYKCVDNFEFVTVDYTEKQLFGLRTINETFTLFRLNTPYVSYWKFLKDGYILRENASDIIDNLLIAYLARKKLAKEE